MPSDIKQLTSSTGSSPQGAGLPTAVTEFRQGSAAAPDKPPAWLAFLCSGHSGALPESPGTATGPDDAVHLQCGTILDYRPPEQLLQARIMFRMFHRAGAFRTEGGIQEYLLERDPENGPAV